MRSPGFQSPRFLSNAIRSNRFKTFRLLPAIKAARKLRCCDIENSTPSGRCRACAFSSPCPTPTRAGTRQIPKFPGPQQRRNAHEKSPSPFFGSNASPQAATTRPFRPLRTCPTPCPRPPAEKGRNREYALAQGVCPGMGCLSQPKLFNRRPTPCALRKPCRGDPWMKATPPSTFSPELTRFTAARWTVRGLLAESSPCARPRRGAAVQPARVRTAKRIASSGSDGAGPMSPVRGFPEPAPKVWAPAGKSNRPTTSGG